MGIPTLRAVKTLFSPVLGAHREGTRGARGRRSVHVPARRCREWRGSDCSLVSSAWSKILIPVALDIGRRIARSRSGSRWSPEGRILRLSCPREGDRQWVHRAGRLFRSARADRHVTSRDMSIAIRSWSRAVPLPGSARTARPGCRRDPRPRPVCRPSQ